MKKKKKQKQNELKHYLAYPFNKFLNERIDKKYEIRKRKRCHDINKVRRNFFLSKNKYISSRDFCIGGTHYGISFWKDKLDGICWNMFK